MWEGETAGAGVLELVGVSSAPARGAAQGRKPRPGAQARWGRRVRYFIQGSEGALGTARAVRRQRRPCPPYFLSGCFLPWRMLGEGPAWGAPWPQHLGLLLGGRCCLGCSDPGVRSPVASL